MKTQEEILKRIDEIEKSGDDFFGFQTSDLMSFLDYEHAKPFLNGNVKESDWEQETRTPKQVMLEYLEFAFEKAYGERGLSAARSMDHYTSWLWLDGDETLYPTLKNYTQYGLPQLWKICKYLGVNPIEE